MYSAGKNKTSKSLSIFSWCMSIEVLFRICFLYIPTGTWGTVSWKIGNFARAIVMWSAPYNHDFYNNRLSVGIIGPYDYSKPEKWAEKMYYGHGNFVVI